MFNQLDMTLTFSNFQSYTKGILIVKAKVRESVPATATEAAYITSVAYYDTFNVRIVSCLSEDM